MTAMIHIIVLACKIGATNPNLAEFQYEKEIKCQKQLITCMNEDTIWTNNKLLKCLDKRVK